MRRLVIVGVLGSCASNTSMRNIFEYDHDWRHADYDIIAHGSMQGAQHAFKMVRCGNESKIIKALQLD